jgi:predicted nucleotidyltransferase
MKSKSLINRIKDELIKLEPNLQIYLFGSRARGDFRIDSDWDVLVVAPEEKITFDYEIKLREPILDLEIEFGETISLLIYSKNDWYNNSKISPLFSNVLNEGLLVN